MLLDFPASFEILKNWRWKDFQPYYEELMQRPLTSATLHQWMLDTETLTDTLYEIYIRLEVASLRDTANKAIAARREWCIEELMPYFIESTNQFDRRLIESSLVPENFQLPLQRKKMQLEIFSQNNLPLLTEEKKFEHHYNQIKSEQTVEWENIPLKLTQLKSYLQDANREKRENVWRLSANRLLHDREAIQTTWQKLLAVRTHIAANVNLDYRSYSWQSRARTDYTPLDCEAFHQAVESVVVPAVVRLHEQRCHALGIDTLYPWDLEVDPYSQAPLKPFASIHKMMQKSRAMFVQIDPAFGHYFDEMAANDLFDLENRPHKAAGGYLFHFPRPRQPFIFMNSVGVQRDVETLLHEMGHAIHIFESRHLPYTHQMDKPAEFGEVAAMTMELFGAVHLEEFYSKTDAVRAQIALLEGVLYTWLEVALADEFQHWIYTHTDEAMQAEMCEIKWRMLFSKYYPAVNTDGLEIGIGWQHIRHFFLAPFYYIEYGLAQLGAVQIWEHYRRDPKEAVKQYRQALALGGTATLPSLYATAGTKFAFDNQTLNNAVAVIEDTISELRAQL